MNEGCPDERSLDDFLRGALAAGALAALDAHLRGCPSCSELVGLLARSGEGHAGEDSAGPARGLAPGATVGPYVLRERLGEGAAGVVFRAFDPRLAREVALKLARDERGHDPRVHERLRREAVAMAQLAHPGVVTVFDAGTHEGRVYVAMEVLRGRSLRATLDREGALPWRRALALLVPVAEGLAAAHARGLLHRDVKPENVVLGDAHGRLTDFGLAALDDDAPEDALAEGSEELARAALTRTGALLGTPLYMAPERLAGAPATVQTDLFALAATFYEALAGRRPFEARDLAALRAAHERGPRPLARAPRWLDDAVRAALARDPAARPASVRAWLARLDAGPRTRRRVLGGLAATLVLAATGALLARAASAPRAPTTALASRAGCDAPARREAAFVEPALWSSLRANLARAEPRLAAPAFAALERSVTALGARWQRADERVCRAAPDGAGPSPELVAAQRACLDDARAQTLALLGAFAAPTLDADGARRSFALVDELPSVEPCEDARALLRRRAAPASEAERAARALLDEALAARLAGRADEALARARRAVAAGPPALEARARRELAAALRARGALDEAQREARSAALRAEALRDDGEAARAWLELVAAAGAQGAGAPLAAHLEQAAAAVARVDEPSLRASLRLLEGLAHARSGRLGEARAALDEALALRVEHGGDAAAVRTALGNLARAQGALDEALAQHASALDLDRARYGDDHPALARHEHNLAGVLRRLGRRDEARARYLAALALERRWLDGANGAQALTLNSLGLLALEGGALDEAARWLDEARGLVGARPEAGLVLRNLALLALARGALDEAEARAREALEADERSFDPRHLRVAQARKVLGLALERRGALDEARALLRGALAHEAAGDDDEARELRASCAQALTRIEARRAALTARSQRAPQERAPSREPPEPARAEPEPPPEPAAPPPTAPAALRDHAPEPPPPSAPPRRPPSSGGYGAIEPWGP